MAAGVTPCRSTGCEFFEPARQRRRRERCGIAAEAAQAPRALVAQAGATAFFRRRRSCKSPQRGNTPSWRSAEAARARGADQRPVRRDAYSYATTSHQVVGAAAGLLTTSGLLAAAAGPLTTVGPLAAASLLNARGGLLAAAAVD